MTDEPPTLTIALSNYNHGRFLPAMLDSILAQSYQPLELLLVDDGSTDGSVEILQDYARRYPVIHLTLNPTNLGIFANYNELLRRARGRYFFGASADDVILPGFLESSMAAFAAHPEAGLCSTLSRLIDEQGKDLGAYYHNPFAGVRRPHYVSPGEVLRHFMRKGPWMQGNTTIYRTKFIRNAGGYRSDLHGFCDGFVMQVIALSHGACFVPQALAAWRRMPVSHSGKSRANPQLARGMRETAIRYMETEYRTLFPDRYLRRLRSRWECSILVDFSEEKKREWIGGLRPAQAGEGAPPLVYGCLAAIIAAAAALAKVLAALRFRPFDLDWYVTDQVLGRNER